MTDSRRRNNHFQAKPLCNIENKLFFSAGKALRDILSLPESGLIKINYLLARNNPTASSTSDFKKKYRILRIASILKRQFRVAKIENSDVHTSTWRERGAK